MVDKETESSTSNAKKLAEWLDNRFRIPGTNIRFGLDPVLGLFPGLGDWVAGFASLYFLFEATKREGRISILFRMLLNILLDIVVGAIPILGDIFDVGWKANIKNAELLDELERDPEKTKKQSKAVVWAFCILSVILVSGLLYLVGWLMVKLFETVF